MPDLHSNAPQIVTEARLKYTNDRFYQLTGVMTAASTAAWNYLLVVNGGAAAGTLAFIGAVKELAAESWPFWAFGFFVAGLLCVGFAHAFMAHRGQGLIKNWVTMTQKYWMNRVTWAEVTESDELLVKRHAWVSWALGWAALLLFIGGLIIAAVNFRASSIAV